MTVRLIGELFQTNLLLRGPRGERLIEVLIDEIGHVTYNRLQLNSWAFRQARACLPLVALGLGSPVKEAQVLGLFPIPWGEVLAFEMRHLSQEIKQRAFIA